MSLDVFTGIKTSSGVAGNHRFDHPIFKVSLIPGKIEKRAYALLFDKATRDDVKKKQFDHPLIFGRLCEHCSISDSCDMQQRCAQRCDIQIFLHNK